MRIGEKKVQGVAGKNKEGKVRKFILVISFTLCLALSLYAGVTGKIAGRVIDTETRQPLPVPGVIILIYRTTMEAATDLDGYYYMINVPVGTYEVEARMIGYEPVVQTDVKVSADLTTTLDFELKPTVCQTVSSASKEKKIYFTLRLGQGGFYDDRSPIGKLGGGQLTLDIKPSRLPIAVSISNEYYTNSACPTHSYEIASLVAVNVLYMAKLFKSKRANVFLGGGIGWLEVPKGENESNAMVKGILYNFEGGINVRLFWKIGFYGIGKYLYAKKKTNSTKVIDFSERIVLLGLTLNFGL